MQDSQNSPEERLEEQGRETLLNIDRSILEKTKFLGDAIALLEKTRTLHQKAIERGDSGEIASFERSVKRSEEQVQFINDSIARLKRRRDDHYKFLRNYGFEP